MLDAPSRVLLGDFPNFSGTTLGGPARKNGTGTIHRMVPLRLLILSACALPLFLASAGFAQTIDLSLNVFYSTPSDMTSGGTWQLVGKSTDFGIAGISANVNNIATAQDRGPRGTVNGSNPAGFGSFFFGPDVSYSNLVVGQIPLDPNTLPPGNEESLFYGVGTLTNGSPMYTGQPGGTNSIGPMFTSLTGLQDSPWATQRRRVRRFGLEHGRAAGERNIRHWRHAGFRRRQRR